MPTISIAAIIAVHNAAKTLGRVLQHFAQNSVDIIIIDHGSTDKTAHVIDRFVGKGVTSVIHEPFDGAFPQKRLLEIKENLLANCAADWVIHLDADEIHESSQPGERLRGMLERLDAQGFDAIECDEFVFVPGGEMENHASGDFTASMRQYYYFAPPGRTLHRYVRRKTGASGWSDTGGHSLRLTGLRLAPERVRLRHYIGLSLDHLRAQYLGRVRTAEELQRGWASNRIAITQDLVVVPPPERLFNLDIDGWRTDRPEQNHLIFDQPVRYRAPTRRTGTSDHPPMPFVVGVGRSGTTLLRLMMDAHPRLAMTPETHWLPNAIRILTRDANNIAGLRNHLAAAPSWCDIDISDELLASLLERREPSQPADTLRAIYRIYADRFGAAFVGDKTPVHMLHMLEIAEVLPEARFVHLIRDGRDVAVSYRGVGFGPGRDVRAAAIHWLWRIGRARQNAQFVPHYLEVRYEELVRDPEQVLRRIAEFTTIPYDPVQLQAYRHADQRLAESRSAARIEQFRAIHSLTSSPPDLARIGRWKTSMTAQELAIFEEIAGDMLTDLGYDRAT